MAFDALTAALRLKACEYFGTDLRSSNIALKYLIVKALAVEAKTNTRTESTKILNRRRSKKEADERVGEELIKACVDLNIDEISTCDRNGLARGERMHAFENCHCSPWILASIDVRSDCKPVDACSTCSD